MSMSTPDPLVPQPTGPRFSRRFLLRRTALGAGAIGEPGARAFYIQADKRGSRLTEELLARRYGVSRVPVREALRTLEAEGFVEETLNPVWE